MIISLLSEYNEKKKYSVHLTEMGQKNVYSVQITFLISKNYATDKVMRVPRSQRALVSHLGFAPAPSFLDRENKKTA